MPRPVDERRRRELLDAVVATFAADGIGNRSLRDIAAAAGTSHRMLLHHFGSRDELLVRVVTEIERRQATALESMPADLAGGFSAMWDDVCRDELRPFERLFFECYARGANGEEPFSRLLPGAVNDWLAAAAAHGRDSIDPGLLRLGLAVTRGLLLDLAATDDTEGVTAAARAFAALVADGGVGEDRSAAEQG